MTCEGAALLATVFLLGVLLVCAGCVALAEKEDDRGSGAWAGVYFCVGGGAAGVAAFLWLRRCGGVGGRLDD